MQLIVTTVVPLSPEQLLVLLVTRGLLLCAADRTPESATGHRSAGKLDTHRPGPGGPVVVIFADPGEIAHPVDMGVASNHDVVPDLVVEEMLEGTVLVRPVAVPAVETEADTAILGAGRLNPREPKLVAYHTPFRTALRRLGHLPVEPVLLARAHERSAGVVVNSGDVVIVVACWS